MPQDWNNCQGRSDRVAPRSRTATLKSNMKALVNCELQWVKCR